MDRDPVDTLVINLDHRTDRWNHIVNKWKHSGHLHSVERFSAYKSTQRHRGCSLSHIYAVCNYFRNNEDKHEVLVLEDDCSPLYPSTVWREKYNYLLLQLRTVQQLCKWKVMILSPILPPGLVVLKTSGVDGLCTMARKNLSAAAVLYHRRVIPHLLQLKLYYEQDRYRYKYGIDMALSNLSSQETYIAMPPLAEQNQEYSSDNPGAFSSLLTMTVQKRTHIISSEILHQIQGKSAKQHVVLFNGIYFSLDAHQLTLLAIFVAAVIVVILDLAAKPKFKKTRAA